MAKKTTLGRMTNDSFTWNSFRLFFTKMNVRGFKARAIAMAITELRVQSLEIIEVKNPLFPVDTLFQFYLISLPIIVGIRKNK